MIDLAVLRHFVAVVQTGSFTRAADQLRATQSGVSRAIKRLEDQVGVALLERTTRSLKLTAAGEAFYADACVALERLSVGEGNARRIGEGGHATLRIGICPSTASDTPLLWRGFQAFREAWPNVRLLLDSVASDLLIPALRTSEFDIGIMQMGGADRDGLDSRTIARSPLVVAIPTLWKLRKSRLKLIDLKDRPWIMPHPRRAPKSYERLVDLCRAAGFEPKIAGLTEDRMTSQIMLGSGMGAAFVNAKPRRNEAEGYDLVALADPALTAMATETVVAWSTASTSRHVSEFVRHLKEGVARGA